MPTILQMERRTGTNVDEIPQVSRVLALIKGIRKRRCEWWPYNQYSLHDSSSNYCPFWTVPEGSNSNLCFWMCKYKRKRADMFNETSNLEGASILRVVNQTCSSFKIGSQHNRYSGVDFVHTVNEGLLLEKARIGLMCKQVMSRNDIRWNMIMTSVSFLEANFFTQLSSHIISRSTVKWLFLHR